MLTRGGDLEALRTHRPFRRRGLVRRTLVFPLAILLAFAMFPIGEAQYDLRFATATLLTLLLVAVVLIAPWDRLPGWAQILPLLGFLAVIALLRDAHGGSAAGYAPFLILPLLWLAVYGTRRQFVVGLVAAGLALAVPILAAGGDAYPTDEWRRTVAFLFVGGVLGYGIRALLDRLFTEVDAREEAERMLRERGAFDLHDDVVQDLTTAQLALAVDDRETAGASVSRALGRTQQIVTLLLTPPGSGKKVSPGSLRRTTVVPAARTGDPAKPPS